MRKQHSIPVRSAAVALLLAAWLPACGGPDDGPGMPYGAVEGALVECRALGGAFSGVEYTDEQATNVILLADNGTSAQLDAFPYIGPSLASAVIAGRPYGAAAEPMASLDAVSGIGPQVLASLRDNVDKLWCTTGGCCGAGVTPPPPAGNLVVNEFMPGSSGWIEVYNGGSTPVSLAGYKVDDIANAGAAPKSIGADTLVPANGRVTVSFGGINTASIDSVRLLDAAGAVVDQHENFWMGSSIAGRCFGRSPDGGAWSDDPVVCTKGLANPSPDVEPAQAAPVINEFLAGAFGWVEIYNPGTKPAALGGWSIDDVADGGAAPKVLGAGVELAAKEYLAVGFAGINTASVDSVRLLNASGTVVDARSNGYAGTSLSGRCFGRFPDGGDWSASAIPCTSQGKNEGPAPVDGVPKLLISEILVVPTGWVEVYNAGTEPIATSNLFVRLATKEFYRMSLLDLLNGQQAIPPKSFAILPVGVTNKEPEEVRIAYEPGTTPAVVIDQVTNFFSSPVQQAACYSRSLADGAWYPDALPCTPGAANATPPACAVGAPCNDGNPCTLGDTFTTGCACVGTSFHACDDGNACTFGTCTKALGCAQEDLPPGTPCGTGMECNLGNCAPVATGVCLAKGGTYKTVAFTQAEECDVLEFLNEAPSSAFDFTESMMKLVYDCTPAGVCGYRTGLWTSLSQVTEKVGDCGVVVGATTLAAMKVQAAGWTAGGSWYDTVAGTWSNRAALVGRMVTLENVWVEKALGPSDFGLCWQIRDKPGAANYMPACFAPNNWCDGCSQVCESDCLGPWIGQRRWLRGTVLKDPTVAGGYKIQLPNGIGCGVGVVSQAPNPAVSP